MRTTIFRTPRTTPWPNLCVSASTGSFCRGQTSKTPAWLVRTASLSCIYTTMGNSMLETGGCHADQPSHTWQPSLPASERFHKKCAALGKWREKRGTCVLGEREAPRGWRWRDPAARTSLPPRHAYKTCSSKESAAPRSCVKSTRILRAPQAHRLLLRPTFVFVFGRGTGRVRRARLVSAACARQDAVPLHDPVRGGG